VTAISVFDQGYALPHSSVSAGQIGKLWGLGEIKIGDGFGAAAENSTSQLFAPPTLETVVVPRSAAARGALLTALAQLAEQDPLINLRQDDERREVSVSLYGEVQKEVIQATLANDFGVDVTFRETTTICIERPVGTGSALETIGGDENPFLAGLGVRVEPAAINSGVEFRLEVELGSMPFAFFTAIEQTVHDALAQGIHGWQVTDCRVTVTYTAYCPRQSHSHGTFDKSMSTTAGDFRNLTPMVLMSALQQAGSAVHEPIHQFQLEIPADTLGPFLSALARLGAIPQATALRGSAAILEGEIPAAHVHALQQQLPSLTRGEGVLESAFDRYRRVTGAIPTRRRTNQNPLHRKEYLLQVVRRAGGRSDRV
jgi:ribosomal protection tetracycline resistance protein